MPSTAEGAGASGMEQEFTTQFRSPLMLSAEVAAEPRTAASIALLLMGSLLQTYGVVWLLCPTPSGHTLSLGRLVVKAAGYLVITSVGHVVALWSNRVLFRLQMDVPFRFLLFALWPAVVWLPLLVLLIREGVAPRAVMPVVIASSATTVVRRWMLDADSAGQRDAGEIASLLHAARGRWLVRALAPALGTAVLMELAMGALATGRLLLGGWTLAAGAVFPLWAYERRLRPLRVDGSSRAAVREVLPRTLLVWLLLAIGLLPYLMSGGGTMAKIAERLRKGVGIGSEVPSRDVREGPAGRGSYSGVILIPPVKPRHEVPTPPPEAMARMAPGERRLVVIPFDGAYWYFRAPEQRPRRDAPVVRGDPRKRSIRSTDMRALMMEAHQRLQPPIAMSCCAALRVKLVNAETTPGRITIEVRLRDRGSGQVESLGEQVLASSQTQVQGRAPVDEVVRFPFASGGRKSAFDEITVVIRSANEGGRVGAHVAIESFELVP